MCVSRSVTKSDDLLLFERFLNASGDKCLPHTTQTYSNFLGNFWKVAKIIHFWVKQFWSTFNSNFWSHCLSVGRSGFVSLWRCGPLRIGARSIIFCLQTNGFSHKALYNHILWLYSHSDQKNAYNTTLESFNHFDWLKISEAQMRSLKTSTDL